MDLDLGTAFEQMTDDEVIGLAKQGNLPALEHILRRYSGFVKSRARPYFLMGADREDILQEGMIGLYKAVRDFRPEKAVSFRVFAEVCITRQIITAIKTATRQKHVPLNSYISLNRPMFEDGSEKNLGDLLSGEKNMNPEDLMIDRENYEAIGNKITRLLSDREFRTLSLYLQGKSYQEMAEELQCTVKTVDNALQRVKKKLEKQITKSQ